VGVAQLWGVALGARSNPADNPGDSTPDREVVMVIAEAGIEIAQLESLLSLLTEKTTQGVIAWRATGTSHYESYCAQISGYGFEVKQVHVVNHIPGKTWPYTYRLNITDPHGIFLEGLFPNDSNAIEQRLHALYQKAVKSNKHYTEHAVAELFSVLETL
jgi:hypothetical protein